MKKKELGERLKFATQLAAKAGKCSLRFFQSKALKVEMKGNGTPVSKADKETEALMREAIIKRFPGESILGEELGEDGDSNIRWILDPIDGTESFIRGVPLYGNLIGLEVNQEVLLGVANLPAIGEMIYAASGQGTWWVSSRRKGSAVRAKVSGVREMGKAMTCFSGANYFKQMGQLELFSSLMRNSGNSRGWGDCYGHLLVATGRADASVDPVMEAWDSAALLPIVQEAGGRFTDFSGLPNIRGKSAISANPHLHHQYLDLVQNLRSRTDS